MSSHSADEGQPQQITGIFDRWPVPSTDELPPLQIKGSFNRWPASVSSTDEPRPLQMKGSFNRWTAPGALYPPNLGKSMQAGHHFESWEFWRTQMLKNLNVEELDCWRTWLLKMLTPLKMLTAEKLKCSSADVWRFGLTWLNGRIHVEYWTSKKDVL